MVSDEDLLRLSIETLGRSYGKFRRSKPRALRRALQSLTPT